MTQDIIKTIRTIKIMNNGKSAQREPSLLCTTWTEGTTYYKRISKTSLYVFRPYFEKATNNSRVTRSIIFSNDENSDMPHEEYSDGDIDDTGKLIVKTSRLNIAVKSTLKETVNVRILTMNGITINTFALEPGQTVETRLSNAGVYIVQSANGKLLKKLTVR